MKTPVEWLEEQINLQLKDPLSPKFQELFEQAKAYENERIIRDFVSGAEMGEMFNNENRKFEIDAKIYINSKYEKP